MAKPDLSTAVEDMKEISALLYAYTKKYRRPSLVDEALYNVILEYSSDSYGWNVWLKFSVEEVFTKMISKGFSFDLECGSEVLYDYVGELLFEYQLATDEDPEGDN